jgi:hypothetical protein
MPDRKAIRNFWRKEMKKTKESDRRGFLKATGGAIIAAGSIGLVGASAQHHKKAAFSVAGDPLGSATVGFGAWMANFTPPLDRFFNPAGPIPSNHHELIPNVAKIKAGGYIEFIISGLHVVEIYDDGTKPTDINTALLTPLGGPLPPVINDPNRRVYRGVNPVINPGPPPVFVTDRVEVVHFEMPGTYLVICGILPHFEQGMFGYVRVLSNSDATAMK